MDESHFAALKKAKKDNYELIYDDNRIKEDMFRTVRPMMEEVYEKLLDDLIAHKTDSPIFTHHINYVSKAHYERQRPYGTEEPNQIVVDYIASMTDDYFIELHRYLFPNSDKRIEYKGYFD